jgi:cephalosporin hydroxylase
MITFDFEKASVTVVENGQTLVHPMSEPAAFEAVSRAWLRAGWDVKYVYSFTWFGRPMIQLPDDMMRLQEVIYAIKPDVIIECGVAHGGGLVFYASLLKAMGKGRVIGVDVEIRPHNRRAIEGHPLFPLITLIEASSVAPETAAKVKSLVQPGETVMVMLDSSHTKAHVLAELEAYGPLVSNGSYIVAMDGIMELVAGGPRTKPDWSWNNPKYAALEFVEKNKDFEIVEPPFPFNEGVTRERVTYWPCGFIQRKR